MMSQTEIIEQSKKLDGKKSNERQRILTRINAWKGVHEEVQINSDMFNEINGRGGK